MPLLLCHRDGSIVKGGWRPDDGRWPHARLRVLWTNQLDLRDESAWFERILIDPEGVAMYWEEAVSDAGEAACP